MGFMVMTWETGYASPWQRAKSFSSRRLMLPDRFGGGRRAPAHAADVNLAVLMSPDSPVRWWRIYTWIFSAAGL